MGSYKIIVSSQAFDMLAGHVAFVGQVNEQAALQLAVAFEEAMTSLEELPQRCPFLVDEYIPRNKYRKLLVEDRYLMIYQIIDENVYIESVVDCRQDYGWLINR